MILLGVDSLQRPVACPLGLDKRVDWEQKLVINIILNRESGLLLFYLTKIWKVTNKPRRCCAQPFWEN